VETEICDIFVNLDFTYCTEGKNCDSASMRMMRYLLIVFAVLGSAMVATAEKFDYNKVIAPPIKAMGPPEFWNGVGSLNLLVSTGSKEAEEHVKQGFALLHGQWDVEAYRHFSAALAHDDTCLLAYCGVVLSVLNPEHEWKAYRNVARSLSY